MGERHGRQSRLAGIGAEGQARIGCASVEVRRGGLAGEVAARYLAGAGVGGLKVPSEEVAAAARAVDARVPVEVEARATPPADEGARACAALEDAAANELLEGALFALRGIKRALEAPQ